MVEPGDWVGSRYAFYEIPFRDSRLLWRDKHTGLIYDQSVGGNPVDKSLRFRNVMGNDAVVNKVKGGVNLKKKRGKPIHLVDRKVQIVRGE